MRQKPAKKKKIKLFNVFYTTLPCEHELLVKGYSQKDASDKVRELLGREVQSVRDGWEIKATYSDVKLKDGKIVYE